MHGLASNCAICGGCFCVPDARTIATWIPKHGSQDIITEDNVDWLKRFRILGEASPGNADSVFLTGSCRKRRGYMEITRGTAADVCFGTVLRHQGEGENEVLAVRPSISSQTLATSVSTAPD